MRASLPPDEETRLEALHRYHVLDTEEEEVYNNLVRLAAHFCGVPIAAVTLVDEGRQWFKSRVGLELTQTPRDFSFCAHAILERGVTVVPDMREDPRFSDNPLVTSAPTLVFYAGAPLVDPEGHPLGTLCVMGRNPHSLNREQTAILQALSRHVVCQLEVRHAVTCQALVLSRLKQAEQEGDSDYQAVHARAAAYIFETTLDIAHHSYDAALSRFYGYKSLEELFAQLDDI